MGPATPDLDVVKIEIINGRPVLGLASGSVELVEVQPAGKPRISGQSWANGRRGVGLTVEEPGP